MKLEDMRAIVVDHDDFKNDDFKKSAVLTPFLALAGTHVQSESIF